MHLHFEVNIVNIMNNQIVFIFKDNIQVIFFSIKH